MTILKQTATWITLFNTKDHMQNESPTDKFNRGLDIFIESVIEPDHNLRADAHEQKCYHELMYIRSYVLDYLKTLRRP